MGIAIERERFDARDYARFSDRLRHNLEALAQLLARPGFGHGDASFGAELEVFLVGPQGAPMHVNGRVLEELNDDRFTLELDRFNLECNATPRPLAGRPFSGLGDELSETLHHLSLAAERHGSNIAMIGILPTLQQADLDRGAMTDLPRYRALSHALRAQRGAPFHFHISGRDSLLVDFEHVTFEGANTSLQLHLRVAPEQFTRMYNACQLATAPALAACSNSPTFLGRRLWHETHIALFKQAVDDRRRHGVGRSMPRVCFGNRWIRHGSYELFEESVRRHDPLLPVVHSEDPLLETRHGRLPGLHELRLHNSTVWSWNRPVYDPSGHLRIEMRALPAGPTIGDMLANSAFTLGLAHHIADQAHDGVAPLGLPFELAHDNFYRAAQHGLSAQLAWAESGRVVTRSARDLVLSLCEPATLGLINAGVDESEARHHVSLLRARVERGQTGSRWQLARLGGPDAGPPSPSLLSEMTIEYMERSRTQTPVHEWPLPGPPIDPTC